VLGGFLAVAWTDLFQGLLMAAVALFLPILGIIELGGFDGLTSALANRGPEFLTLNAGKTGNAFVFGIMIGGLSWGLGYFGQPHLLTRYMAIRKVRDLRQGSLIALSDSWESGFWAPSSAIPSRSCRFWLEPWCPRGWPG
jgi:sodium/proline symporter